MNKGGGYEAIFEDKNDYSVFLELLRETVRVAFGEGVLLR
jgi:hypothetical protein